MAPSDLFQANNLIISTPLSLMACNGEELTQETVVLPSLNDISDSAWQRLTEKKIFFGHRFNIVDGIEDLLKENPQLDLNLAETSIPEILKTPNSAENQRRRELRCLIEVTPSSSGSDRVRHGSPRRLLYHWSDPQGLDQTLVMARPRPVHLGRIEACTRRVRAELRYRDFAQRLG